MRAWSTATTKIASDTREEPAPAVPLRFQDEPPPPAQGPCRRLAHHGEARAPARAGAASRTPPRSPRQRLPCRTGLRPGTRWRVSMSCPTARRPRGNFSRWGTASSSRSGRGSWWAGRSALRRRAALGHLPLPQVLGIPGMQKQTVLYGLDLARQRRFTVVVEGVTTPGRGPEAVALLGKNPSFTQFRMLVVELGGRPVAVMLDGDAPGKQKILRAAQGGVGGRRGPGRPPAGRGPRRPSREANLNLIYAAAETRGPPAGTGEGRRSRVSVSRRDAKKGGRPSSQGRPCESFAPIQGDIVMVDTPDPEVNHTYRLNGVRPEETDGPARPHVGASAAIVKMATAKTEAPSSWSTPTVTTTPRPPTRAVANPPFGVICGDGVPPKPPGVGDLLLHRPPHRPGARDWPAACPTTSCSRAT